MTLFKNTLYNTINEKLICTPYAGSAGMLLHRNLTNSQLGC